MNLFKKKNQIVRYFPITQIGTKHTEKLRRQLDQLKKGQNISAIVAGINLRSGPIVQAEVVGYLLKKKATDLGVPLITSAEEQVFSTGLHLLMYGDTIICNPCSMIGNLGFTANPL